MQHVVMTKTVDVKSRFLTLNTLTDNKNNQTVKLEQFYLGGVEAQGDGRVFSYHAPFDAVNLKHPSLLRHDCETSFSPR